MCAINAKVIPVATYPMNVCKFTSGELNELDQVIKRELRSKKMLGKQASDERLYLKKRWRKRNKIIKRHLQRDPSESSVLHGLFRK